MTNQPETIGQRIRRIRKSEPAWTIGQLSHATGISAPMLQQYETKRCTIPGPKLKKIAEEVTILEIESIHHLDKATVKGVPRVSTLGTDGPRAGLEHLHFECKGRRLTFRLVSDSPIGPEWGSREEVDARHRELANNFNMEGEDVVGQAFL